MASSHFLANLSNTLRSIKIEEIKELKQAHPQSFPIPITDSEIKSALVIPISPEDTVSSMRELRNNRTVVITQHEYDRYSLNHKLTIYEKKEGELTEIFTRHLPPFRWGFLPDIQVLELSNGSLLCAENNECLRNYFIININPHSTTPDIPIPITFKDQQEALQISSKTISLGNHFISKFGMRTHECNLGLFTFVNTSSEQDITTQLDTANCDSCKSAFDAIPQREKKEEDSLATSRGNPNLHVHTKKLTTTIVHDFSSITYNGETIILSIESKDYRDKRSLVCYREVNETYVATFEPTLNIEGYHFEKMGANKNNYLFFVLTPIPDPKAGSFAAISPALFFIFNPTQNQQVTAFKYLFNRNGDYLKLLPDNKTIAAINSLWFKFFNAENGYADISVPYFMHPPTLTHNQLWIPIEGKGIINILEPVSEIEEEVTAAIAAAKHTEQGVPVKIIMEYFGLFSLRPTTQRTSASSSSTPALRQ